MAYHKLTKRQRKDRDRILAWLNDEEFRENSRSKPAVPDLIVEDVLEQYVPPDVTGAGQFFTPIEMARELISYMKFYDSYETKVLDPCAGVGHLLCPLCKTACTLIAVELEEECVQIGRKLFPQIHWYNAIPFDMLTVLESQFDVVVMNPPFNTRRGMAPGDRMCEGRCTKSEHIFLELAIRATKPGGQIGVIASYNYYDKMPGKLRAWMKDKAELVTTWGPLHGEFALSSISVHGFIFDRLDESEPVLKREYRQADPYFDPFLKMPDDYMKCPTCGLFVQIDAEGIGQCSNCKTHIDLSVKEKESAPINIPMYQQLALF